jgi:hypothetical protein
MAAKPWIIAATTGSALTLLVGGAQSAPLASALTELGSTSAVGAGLQRVAYRCVRNCRWVNGSRVYGFRRVSGYAAPPVFGYVAPRAYGPSPPIVSGNVAPSSYVESLGLAPVYAPPAYGYAAAPIRRVVPAIEYALPNVYPVGSPAWWGVMDKLDLGGRPE